LQLIASRARSFGFELTTGGGLPYEYDIAGLSPHALYHLEVKAYHGAIRGNPLQ